MIRSNSLRLGICAAAFALILASFASSSSEARGRGGGGGGGGGFSRGGGGGFSRGGGLSIGRSARSVSSVRSLSVSRSLSSRSIATRNVTRSAGVTRSQPFTGTGHQTNKVADGNPGNRGLDRRTVKGVGSATALRNNAFASLSTRNAKTQGLARSTFHGRFAERKWVFSNQGWHWLHRRPIIVIGWLGPLFWPYAYWDIVDYTYWPYAYDVFWPRAYDDLYVGVFGPYAYEGPGYSRVAAAGGAPRSSRRTRASQSASASAIVCGERVPALTDWPIQQIAQTIEPDPTQQMALDELKAGAAKAINALQSACPDELPSTPPGRFAAMRKRIETMMTALGMVQVPLGRLYDSLSDEQKARFNAVTPVATGTRTARRGNPVPDMAEVCSAKAAKPTDVPGERLERELRPTDPQRIALNKLNDATLKAAEVLGARCPTEQALTPPGRVKAMEQRLNAMLEAIKVVQPALDEFYGSLDDEQKARFNQLGAPQG